MERVDNAEELLAIFHQTRLAPLGNTFLKVGEAEKPADAEPVVVRRRRSINLKAHSIPDYIPHQLVSMYGDSDIFEDATPTDFDTYKIASENDPKLDVTMPKDLNKPLAPPATHLADPATFEPAFVGRTFSEKTDDTFEPAFVERTYSERSDLSNVNQLVDNAVNAAKARRNRQLELSPAPSAPGLEGLSAPGLEGLSPLLTSAPAAAPTAAPEPPAQATPPPAQKRAEGQATNSGPAQGPITTLMIRNLPHELLQSQLAADIDASGFKGLYDFLYMPSTFGTGRGKGYAFVNFATPEVADCFSALWHNTCRYGNPSEHVLLNVSVACIQGRDANVARWDTSKMRRIRNANHRPLVTVLMADSGAMPPMMPQAPAPSPLPTLATSPALAAPVAKPAPVTNVAQAEDTSPQAIVGKWCKINGLQRMTHANGLWGMVEAYDEQLERYIMRVPVDADHWFMAKILRANLDLPATSR